MNFQDLLQALSQLGQGSGATTPQAGWAAILQKLRAGRGMGALGLTGGPAPFTPNPGIIGSPSFEGGPTSANGGIGAPSFGGGPTLNSSPQMSYGGSSMARNGAFGMPRFPR